MSTSASPIFLDTTIKVDEVLREIDPQVQKRVEHLLEQFGLRFSCAFSRLEFKRVVIQNIALTLKYLDEEKSYFKALHRSTRLQYRKKDTLPNILAWVGMKVNSEVVVSGSSLDQELTARAESYLRNSIIFLWHKFSKSTELTDAMKCQRALETPRMKTTGMTDVAIHEGKCADKKCQNASFFQSQLPRIRQVCDAIEANNSDGRSDELAKSREMLRRAEGDMVILYNYQNCLAVGDVWIHLEAKHGAVSDFLSTNYKESELLCRALGLRFHDPNKVKLPIAPEPSDELDA